MLRDIPSSLSSTILTRLRAVSVCRMIIVTLLLIVATSSELDAEPLCVMTGTLRSPSDSSSSYGTSTNSIDAASEPDSGDYGSMLKYLSKGWYPQPPSATYVGFISNLNLVVIDHMNGLRSSAFAKTRSGFTTSDPFIRSESDIKQKYSMEDATGATFSDSYSSDGLVVMKSMPWMSAVFRAHATYDRINSVFYSVDDTKRFVTTNGELRSLKEVNVLNLRQERCNIGASFIIPVYGIFIQSELVNATSYYYVSVGINASLATRNLVTQYVQIAGPKDAIRMANGTDTVRVLDNVPIETMQRVQSSLTIGVGWTAGFSRFSTSFEPFVTIPVHSLLRDASWYQIPVGLRFVLAYQADADD